MPTETDLTANDSLWLTLASPENQMVIDTVLWFHHRLDPEAVINQVQERVVDRYPIFHWKPRYSDSPGAKHGWVEDPDFDIRQQITVHELGGAAGPRCSPSSRHACRSRSTPTVRSGGPTSSRATTSAR